MRQRTFGTFCSFLFLSSILLVAISCKKKNKSIKQAEVTFKKEGELVITKTSSDSTQITLDIEIADNDYEIQTGLMYRNSIGTDQGMLFVFDDTRERFFYMKNTRFPLDIIFIGKDKKIVSFQKLARPFDETSLPSKEPAKYVLEINSGLVDTWGLSAGDQISYSR